MKKTGSMGPMWIRLLVFLGLCALVIIAGSHIYQVAGHGVFLGHFDKIWGAIFVTYLFVSALFLVGALGQFFFTDTTNRILQPVLKFRYLLRWLRWGLALLLVGWFAFLFGYSTYSDDFSSFAVRLYLFIVCVVLCGIILTDGTERLLTWTGFLQGTILFGTVFLLAKKLITVTNFPLSLSWSEGNRLWDYSVLFGRDLYIYPVDQPIDALIDLGRQSLWGLPFFYSDITIFQARLWSVMVGLLPHAVFGWIIFKIPQGNRRVWIFMGLWTMLFLQQGPIYSPLILAAILVALARGRPLWLGLLLVFVAGYYAQMSRYTWMFAPAMWAMMVSVHDLAPERLRQDLKSWGRIFAYGLAGLLGGVVISGWERLAKIFTRIPPATGLAPNIANQTSEAVEIGGIPSNSGLAAAISDQPLLWSRLLPGPTYPEGILLGLLIAVGPLILFLFYLVISNRWKLNRWQKLSILLPLSLFFIVGLIISVKIGGGDNLHNLDMFLISLIFVTALAWGGAGEFAVIHIDKEPYWLRISVALAVAIPAFYPVINTTPLKLPPLENIELTLEYIQKESQLAVSQGEEVLFMDQRQLLTFGFVEGVPLVADYEKKFVMNKAMSGDIEYFENFYRDLANHRFGLIISEPQVILYAASDDAWAAENDIWVEWVTKPLLCYYEPKHDFKKTSVWLFMPREEPLDCTYP